MSDESLIKTIDNQVETLTKSIQEGRALHLRDRRVEPDDGYGNYETIVEAQVTDALLYEKKAAVSTLQSLKRYLLTEKEET
jgi:hypothetical protein